MATNNASKRLPFPFYFRRGTTTTDNTAGLKASLDLLSDATSVEKFHADSLYYFKSIYAGGTSTFLQEKRNFFLATNFCAPSHFSNKNGNAE